jgi:hypothetical protein
MSTREEAKKRIESCLVRGDFITYKLVQKVLENKSKVRALVRSRNSCLKDRFGLHRAYRAI